MPLMFLLLAMAGDVAIVFFIACACRGWPGSSNKEAQRPLTARPQRNSSSKRPAALFKVRWSLWLALASGALWLTRRGPCRKPDGERREARRTQGNTWRRADVW